MWREPAEGSEGLYPNLVVHDGRVTGSITAGATRLPLWAFVPQLIHDGWDGVEANYPLADKVGARGLAQFLYDLLEMRGEFGRLLLVLADAHRREVEREAEALEPHGPVVRISLRPGDGGVELPGGWWEDPEMSRLVREQLQRCLDLLPDAE